MPHIHPVCPLAALGFALAAISLLPPASGASADSPVPAPAYRNPTLTVDDGPARGASRPSAGAATRTSSPSPTPTGAPSS